MDLVMERLDYLQHTNKSAKQYLEYTSWVDDLNPAQAESLSTYFTLYLAPTGTLIIRETEAPAFFCIICEGLVDVVKENSSGKLKKLKTFGPGKAIGEMAFFDKSPSSASIIAKSPTILLIMNESSFQALCHDSPHIALKMLIKLLRTISYRLRETSGKLIDLI